MLLRRKCKHVTTCETPAERAAPMVNIKYSRPLELVCIDFLSVEPNRSNTKDIIKLQTEVHEKCDETWSRLHFLLYR